MTEMDELKPCPFCGGNGVLDPYNEPDGEYSVYCSQHDHNPEAFTRCTCDLGIFGSKAEAIAAWNRRPSLSPAGVTEEQVEAAARAYLLANDIDPDLPHGLKPDGKAWWKVEAARIRAALEAAAKAQPSISTGQGEPVGVNRLGRETSTPDEVDAWESYCAKAKRDGQRVTENDFSSWLKHRRLLYTHPSLPAGHVAVPVELTEEMYDAFFRARDEIFPEQMERLRSEGRGWKALPHVVWETMLSARPHNQGEGK